MHNYYQDFEQVRSMNMDWQEFCVLQMMSGHTFDSFDQFNTVAHFLISVASGIENSPEDVVQAFFDGLTYGKYTIDDLDTEDGYMKVENYVYETLEENYD